MSNPLKQILDHIGQAYKSVIEIDSEHYMEVSLARTAQALGYEQLRAQYKDAYAMVPLKAPVPGMKVRIDGRSFVHYCRHPSGFAVPGYIAKDAGMRCRAFVPGDSLILNCA